RQWWLMLLVGAVALALYASYHGLRYGRNLFFPAKSPRIERSRQLASGIGYVVTGILFCILAGAPWAADKRLLHRTRPSGRDLAVGAGDERCLQWRGGNLFRQRRCGDAFSAGRAGDHLWPGRGGSVDDGGRQRPAACDRGHLLGLRPDLVDAGVEGQRQLPVGQRRAHDAISDHGGRGELHWHGGLERERYAGLAEHGGYYSGRERRGAELQLRP